MNKISGIYAITNTINGKKYVGSSKSVLHRWNQSHRPELRKNKHKNNHLQRAWNKYGEDGFKFEIIEECEESILAEKEGFWIEHYKSWNRSFGYNLNRIIQERTIISEETKQKLSDALWRHEIPKKEFYQKVNDMFDQGMSKNKIAKILGCKDRIQVYACLEFSGKHKNEGKGSIVKLTDEVIKKINEFRESGMAWEEIFKITGISRTHFYRKMKIKDGNYGGGKKGIRVKYRTMTPELKQQAIQMRNEGKSWKEIGKKLGVARQLFYEHGIAENQKNMVRKSVTPEIALKAISMRKENKTWEEIAEEIEIGRTTLRNYFKNKEHENQET